MDDKLTDTELYPRLQAMLQKVAYKSKSLDNVTPDTRLLEGLDIDSARLVDLVLNLEDEFGIRIEDNTIEDIKTVQDLANLVRQKAA